MRTDEERIEWFINEHGLEYAPQTDVDGMRAHLRTLFAEVRAEAALEAANPKGEDVEARVRRMLADLVPPGTVMTQALMDDVKKKVREFLFEELVAEGVPEQLAIPLANAVSGSVRLRPAAKAT